MDNSNKLRNSFEKYDSEKDDYYKNLIQTWESQHKNDLESKYKSKVELFNYVKSLETDINKYKSQEREYDSVLETLNSQLKRIKKNEEELKKEIKKVKQKINVNTKK